MRRQLTIQREHRLAIRRDFRKELYLVRVSDVARLSSGVTVIQYQVEGKAEGAVQRRVDLWSHDQRLASLIVSVANGRSEHGP